MEITVTDFNARDEIMIRTRFSAYSFRVTDPPNCRGLLSGGLLGDQPHDAFFAGAISPGCGQLGDLERLEAGCRAVFFVEGTDLKVLTTSIIMGLDLSETEPGVC